MTADRQLGYAAALFIWVRWFVLAGCILEASYRVELGSTSHILNIFYNFGLMTGNGYVHYRLRSEGTVRPRWMLALSVMDLAAISFSVSLSGGFDSRFFVLYYPMIAMFALVFASPFLGFPWATLTSAVYVTLSLVVGDGLNFEEYEEKHLYYRVLAMYWVVGCVSLLARFERLRIRAAMEREWELQRHRSEVSQAIHDTGAQTAYMIDLGLDRALRQAGTTNPDLVDTLEATSRLSKSAMWELRHPMDVGRVFEGRGLGRVLRSHSETFSRITSVPTEMVQTGSEPPITTGTRVGLLSVAHNALTNAFRHGHATCVRVRLDFGAELIRLSVADDGVGLPDGYAEQGHGFAGMRAAAERMGGRLIVVPDRQGGGTEVTCEVPYDNSTRGG